MRICMCIMCMFLEVGACLCLRVCFIICIRIIHIRIIHIGLGLGLDFSFCFRERNARCIQGRLGGCATRARCSNGLSICCGSTRARGGKGCERLGGVDVLPHNGNVRARQVVFAPAARAVGQEYGRAGCIAQHQLRFHDKIFWVRQQARDSCICE